LPGRHQQHSVTAKGTKLFAHSITLQSATGRSVALRARPLLYVSFRLLILLSLSSKFDKAVQLQELRSSALAAQAITPLVRSCQAKPTLLRSFYLVPTSNLTPK